MAQSDFLNPKWQQFRLKRLELANWQCEVCGSEENTLHVHHPFYISGRKPWEYLPETTMVLCDECHEIVHDFQCDFTNLGASGWEYAAAERIKAHSCLASSRTSNFTPEIG
jgi:hypothetical protein